MNRSATAEAKLRAVIDGARTILEKKTFATAARAIFDHCRALTGAVSGYVALLSADGQENELLFLEAGGLPCSVPPELPMPIRGLRSVAYESHATVYRNDFMTSEWAAYLPGGHVELRNVLFSPLNIDGVTVGIMGLANKPTDFTDDDAEIAGVLGELAAIALMNSRHLDLLQQQKAALEQTLAQVRTLSGLLPMCAGCKKIRDDDGFWTRVDAYISDHTDAQFSHGLCPECIERLYPEISADDEGSEDPPRRHGA